ncbi:hypothetical protein ACIA5G_49375 [Amycolatopsis sp. NPDC051758]|uniref:hypothetical protein n=1 Tax=Amycolatopsis sp. NPDC051758 TaxID=3363935 RepID=UPI00379E1FBA
MLDVSTASRYIAVAAPGPITDREWKDKIPDDPVSPPVHKDYALMKVLHTLRRSDRAFGIRVHPFQHTNPVTPLDFSGLRDSDVIFVVGHGSDEGLYDMGPDAEIGTRRFVDILTGDGNLKRLRQGKGVTILLLSCRAGFGFHKAVAFELSQRIGIDVTVGGSLGFTFGSVRTSKTARNEVLIRGIPWDMEYPNTITRREAEEATSALEGKTITVAGKQAEITRFLDKKTALELRMNDFIQRLQSTEVNAALIELDLRFGRRGWEALLRAQFELYFPARTKSNLEFDMWFGNPPDGYVWTDGRKVTAAEVKAILVGDLTPVTPAKTSTR